MTRLKQRARHPAGRHFKGVGLRPPTSARSSSADSALLAAAMSSRAVRRHWAVAVHDDPQQPALPAETTSTASNSRSNSASTGRSRSAIWLSLMCVLRSGWVRQLCATTPSTARPDRMAPCRSILVRHWSTVGEWHRAAASLPFGRREALVFLASLPVALAGCGTSDPAINEPRINSSGAISPPADSPSAPPPTPTATPSASFRERHSNRR